MALRVGRIGSIPDAIQFDDGDFDTAIEVDYPIRVNSAPVNANDVLRQSDLPGGVPVDVVTSTANITDHSVVRGAGGVKGVQDSGVLIDDSDNVTIPGIVIIQTIKSGATQVAAGAAANELWKTNGHLSLPNNIVMIGV